MRILDLVRPHWKALAVALVAVLGETLADVLEPSRVRLQASSRTLPMTFMSDRSMSQTELSDSPPRERLGAQSTIRKSDTIVG